MGYYESHAAARLTSINDEDYFRTQGRSLLANGYLIIPIKPGHKRPAIANWQRARLGAADLSEYKGHGVGVLCGQGAHPIVAVDVDSPDARLVEQFVQWCGEHLGDTCVRVGKAPKTLLVYRAESAGWGKATSAWFTDEFETEHRLELLGNGQQFVAYHLHPDTGKPYEWIDLLGGLEEVRADELPVVTQTQMVAAIEAFERMAAAAGLQRKSCAVPQGTARVARTPADEEDYFGRVNESALAHLEDWVPALFPTAKPYRGGYRVESIDLGRDLEEAIGIQPDGIVDFGVADMGDPRAGKRTPIDLVLEWSASAFEELIDAPLTPFEAAQWLCDCMETPREQLGFGLKRQREKAAERSAKRAALSGYLQKVAECDDSLVLMGEVAKIGRGVVSATPELYGEVADAFKKRYRALTGATLPAAELRRALREASKPTVRAARPLTEFGNAERMLDKYGSGMMYVPELAAWYLWTGVYWRRAPDVEIENWAKQTVKALIGEADQHADDAAEFFKFCAMSQQMKMVRAMVALAASDPRVTVPAAELDKHSRYMGAKNGVIDLWTGGLLPPDPELRITRTAACDYVPGAKAPLWEKVLKDVLIDEELVEFVQRLIGYSALGDPSEDVMAIPFGDGSNGKSTVLGTVRELLGGYARSADAGTFVDDAGGGNAGGAREDLVRLKGARFVYVNEPNEGAELREGSVKAMTGGDAITARAPYGTQSIEFVPSWVAYMPTNHKPIIKGTDNGIWRRIVLIPFLAKFPEGDPRRIPDMDKKLMLEAEGILNWIVQGALSYRKNRLKKAGVVKAACEEYRADMDLLAEWLDEHCEFSPQFFTSLAALWKSWEEFAKNRGLLQYVKNSVSLGRRLDSRFPAGKGTGGVRIRKGLRLREYDPLF